MAVGVFMMSILALVFWVCNTNPRFGETFLKTFRSWHGEPVVVGSCGRVFMVSRIGVGSDIRGGVLVSAGE